MTGLPLLDLADVPESQHHRFTVDSLGDRPVFRVWAHNTEVLEATLEHLNVRYGQLGERRKELVILTVARTRGARDEWHQHVDIAREKGVALAEMQAIGLLVDFYDGLCNYIAAVSLPFEGGSFLGWTPGAETIADRFD